MQRLLRATIDPAHYHLGWNFERLKQDGNGVRVHFSEGRTEQADILIGGEDSGWIGEVHPLVCREWDLEAAAGFELDLAPLIDAAPYGEETFGELPPGFFDMPDLYDVAIDPERGDDFARDLGTRFFYRRDRDRHREIRFTGTEWTGAARPSGEIALRHDGVSRSRQERFHRLDKHRLEAGSVRMDRRRVGLRSLVPRSHHERKLL